LIFALAGVLKRSGAIPARYSVQPLFLWKVSGNRGLICNVLQLGGQSAFLAQPFSENDVQLDKEFRRLIRFESCKVRQRFDDVPGNA
jgi:hypothetical protein